MSITNVIDSKNNKIDDKELRKIKAAGYKCCEIPWNSVIYGKNKADDLCD